MSLTETACIAIESTRGLVTLTLAALEIFWEIKLLEFLGMVGLRIEISRFVEDGQPNVVECRFLDAYGQEHFIIEKVPVISAEDLGPGDTYPRAEVIACTVIQKKGERDLEIVEIDTRRPWGIESVEGESLFDVRSNQLIEFANEGK
jgi:hypothetical protein